MSVAYTPAVANANEDAYTGREVDDPITYTAYDAKVWAAKYFGQETQNELLALLGANVADKNYRQSYTCIAGLNVGDPVYISANNTATLAVATSAAAAAVIGFVRYKPTTTTCRIQHFRYKSGLSGLTAGAPVYLSDTGTFSASAGTVKKIVGSALSTTEALLYGDAVFAQIAFSGLANPTGTIGLSAVNGTLTTAMRSDAAPALSQAIAPTWSGTHTWNGSVQILGEASGGYFYSWAGATTTGWRYFATGQQLWASAGTLKFGLLTNGAAVDANSLLMWSGTAGDPTASKDIVLGRISASILRLDSDGAGGAAKLVVTGGLTIGGTAPSTGSNVLKIESGTAWTSVADAVAFGSLDSVAGQANCWVQNEAGVKKFISGLEAARTATQTVTDSTALTADNQLSVAVVAGKTYHFRLTYHMTTVNTSGVQVDLNGGTATMTSLRAGGHIISTSAGTFVGAADFTALTSTVGVTATGTTALVIVQGCFVVNAAGTFIPRFAQNAETGAAESVIAGVNSTLVLTSIA